MKLFTLQDTDSDDETSCNSKVPPPNSSQTLRGESACIQICSLEFLPLKCLIIILSSFAWAENEEEEVL